ncbi:MAG: S8 family serine peptidase, partial [Proteobacteria bacterium]|nr:S8 family serine peptidase [Pseudomonadota bacterium]
ICVGSVNEKLDISIFSNIPINFNNVIYARGEFDHSITPLNYCRNHHSFEFYFSRTNRNDGSWGTVLNDLLNEIRNCPKTRRPIKGTSFATPLVSRRLAKIWMDHPHLSSKEVILEVLSLGENVRTVDGKEVKVLSFEAPSWLD